MPYVNPVPAIDAGKEFELRLRVKFERLRGLDDAKRQAAEYILSQDAETIASWLSCCSVKALYPSDLTQEELDYLTGKSSDTHE